MSRSESVAQESAGLPGGLAGKIALTLVFLGVVWFGGSLDQPLLEVHPGRQVDTALIARAFLHEGLDILQPRLPVVGVNPGYLAAEFQLYPYLVAVLYRVFGLHEMIGRLLSLSCALLALFFFLAVLQRHFSRGVVFATGLVWCASPLFLTFAQTFQPDALLLLLVTASWWALERFREHRRRATLLAAVVLLALAVLVKLPAAILLLPLGFVVVEVPPGGRWPGLVERWAEVATAAFVVLLPAAAWYRHTARFAEGSVSWDVLGHLRAAETLAYWLQPAWWGELILNWCLLLGPPGAVVVVMLGWSVLARHREHRLMGLWLAGLVPFYLLTAWSLWRHEYYHLIALPPFMYGFAGGAAWLGERFSPFRAGRIGLVSGLVALTLAGLAWSDPAARDRWLPRDPHRAYWQVWDREHHALAPRLAELASWLNRETPLSRVMLITSVNISLYYSGLRGWVVLPAQVDQPELQAMVEEGGVILLMTLPPPDPFGRQYVFPSATARFIGERFTLLHQGEQLLVFVERVWARQAQEHWSPPPVRLNPSSAPPETRTPSARPCCRGPGR
jgi:4-amino-4-deoxy-L-arabinose transferase-like glycosyltransferase